jgi:hypothetical protein
MDDALTHTLEANALNDPATFFAVPDDAAASAPNGRTMLEETAAA